MQLNCRTIFYCFFPNFRFSIAFPAFLKQYLYGNQKITRCFSLNFPSRFVFPNITFPSAAVVVVITLAAFSADSLSEVPFKSIPFALGLHFPTPLTDSVLIPILTLHGRLFLALEGHLFRPLDWLCNLSANTFFELGKCMWFALCRNSLAKIFFWFVCLSEQPTFSTHLALGKTIGVFRAIYCKTVEWTPAENRIYFV